MSATPGQMLTLPSGSVWASEVHTHPCGAVIVCWHHVGGPKDIAGILNATRRKDQVVVTEAPPALGVAITTAAAVALIAGGLILAFGNGHGWWAAGLIAGGLLLLGRVLDVRGRR